jgi:His/Glu/Gln/Arg/opine family amino acid ABC transporter permease subunit
MTPMYVLLLLKGAVVSLKVCTLGIILGCVLGFFISLMRISKMKILNMLSLIYIELFRDSPLLIQLFLFYYGLPIFFNLQVSAQVVVTIVITLNSSAYIAEIFKSAIGGIMKGQWEASYSLGLSHLKSLRYVILPQAFRIAIPPLISEFVGKLKASSLGSVVGFVEITSLAAMIRSITYSAFDVLGITAAIYFVMCYGLSRLGSYLEKRLEIKDVNK